MAKVNRVPLGREDTGAATVYGPSRALQAIVGLAQRDMDRLYRQQEEYANRMYREGASFSQGLNKDYQDISASPLWQSDFADIGSRIVDRGTELRGLGITPYSSGLNPTQQENLNQFNQDLGRARSYKQRADDLYKSINAQLDQVRKNPGAYRERDIENLINFDRNNSFQDFIEGRVQPPTLTPKRDIVDDFSKSGFKATKSVDEFTEAPDGREIKTTVNRIDEDKALQFIDNAFRPGSDYAIEVEERLKDRGIDAPYSSLLGTTDEAEIREYIDGYLRTPSPDNPLMQVFGNQIPSLDSPEYQQFLDDAVIEQLKAEQVLDNAKREAFTGLQAKLPESEKVSYDSSKLNARLARSRDARSAQSHQSLMNVRRLTAETLQKRLSGEIADTDQGEVQDVVFSSIDDDDSEIDYSMIDAVTIKPTAIDLTGVKGYSMAYNESSTEQFRGDLINVGVAAFDKNGNLVKGDINSVLSKDDVTYKPAVWVNSKNDTRVYPATAVPSNLPGPTKKHFESSLEATKRKAKELNETKKQTKKENPSKGILNNIR